MSDDERELFISYHGVDTTGIDRFTVTPAGLERCLGAERPSFGCIRAHGAFALYGDGLLVSSGDTPIILDVDWAGRIRRGWDTRLTGNHMLAFAADARGERLYALGSCLYKSGFSVVDLRDGGVPTPAATPGEWQWLATPGPPRVLQPTPCGERLALGPDSLAVVAGQGEIRLLDAATGQVVRDVSASAMPLDVLVATMP